MWTLSASQVKAEATRLGFSACGLAPAEPVQDFAVTAYRRWIAQGRHGEMHYLDNHEAKRMDPRLLVEGARTVVSLALNYYPPTRQAEDSYQIASYAYGKDYHEVVKAKLQQLLDTLSNLAPQGESLQGRAFCDTAPVMEKYWAWRAGLGWIGKHTQLVIPQAGSHFFLGELILTAPADTYDQPQADRCGRCTRCMDACPSHAIVAPRCLDAARCLSYQTIEYRGELSPEVAHQMGNTIYGCDRCLQACPWNRFATPTHETAFHPRSQLLEMSVADWESLSVEDYRKLFQGSAVKRAKYEGLKRNIQALKRS